MEHEAHRRPETFLRYSKGAVEMLPRLVEDPWMMMTTMCHLLDHEEVEASNDWRKRPRSKASP